jgi:alpha-glucosidase (family GH31 glycosyl hydrolase)
MEWSEAGAFEDRASRAFVHRATDPPAFEVERGPGCVAIDTGALRLAYTGGGARFDASNLSIELRVGGEIVRWVPGADDAGNLRGTTRTLDNVSGPCELEPGLVSRDGWALVDDSPSLVFDGGGWNWLTHRADPDAIDWYLFAHGHDYPAALRDFTAVAGSIPLPPRYVFGSWFSRYWPYTDEQYKAIVEEYRDHGVGLDVLVLDMDWHLDGWTGYTWNPGCFPDPEAFLRWAREHGLRVTLNLHPADGVGRHEQAFLATRRAMGRDRAVYRIPFDCADQRFMRAYFDLLHRPLEAQGVDFWWMDWQQGTGSGMEGLDPLWWLNHLHWEDMETNRARGDLRPLVFSRWGGLGNHRYPIGFSGDTYCDWASLAFQPRFTATAGNVGYAYWSHDIGGHQPGPVDDELYARWVQHGIFSPVLRLHSGREPRAERRIWLFRQDCAAAMRRAFAWRYRLVPYLYTAARRAHDEAVPPFRPLYWEWPDHDEAYERDGQYLFGDQLMIAPVTRPMDPDSGGAPIDVWIPPGAWTAWTTGERLEGPAVFRALAPLEEIPVFVRDGGVVVEGPDTLNTAERPLDPVTVNVFPGERGSATLYEDDGLTNGYRRGVCARTRIGHELVGDERVVRIGAAEGSFEGMPARRAWELVFHGVGPFAGAWADGAELERVEPGAGPGWWFDADRLAIVVVIGHGPVGTAREVRLTPRPVEGLTLRGLGGRLALVERLASDLGDHTPAELARLAGLRASIELEHRPSADKVHALERHAIARLVPAIHACGAPEPDRHAAIARLLGLWLDAGVETSGDASGRVVAHATVGCAPRLPGAGELDVGLTIEPGGAWQTVDDAGARADTIGPGRRVAASWTLAPAEDGSGVGPGEAAIVARVTHAAGTLELSRTVEWLPSISAWWVLGPFPVPFAEQPETEPVERPGELDPSGPPPAIVGGAAPAWRRATQRLDPTGDPNAPFVVDLNALLEGPHEHAVAYAVCGLIAPADMDAELAIGSDDGPRVWLNGERLLDLHVSRGHRPKQDRVPIRLRKGGNRLVVRIGQELLGWEFSAHVVDADDRPIPSVRVELGPGPDPAGG